MSTHPTVLRSFKAFLYKISRSSSQSQCNGHSPYSFTFLCDGDSNRKAKEKRRHPPYHTVQEFAVWLGSVFLGRLQGRSDSEDGRASKQVAHGAGRDYGRNKKETANYKNLIRQHVDLEAVQTRLEEGRSTVAVKKFFRDLLLLFTNVIVFFPKSSPESVAVVALRQLVSKELACRN
ncbi:hypothetical protein NE237_016945 [Protea cynaroides]|uniref:Bromo domain-containing protein n=1 Tax=Protea cynaroides TaxID=273540 RepID=A0A9Q0HH64_9MAGN|nr:hypothetical protein NE237_016945 [Protea cynaroides]